MCEPPYNPENPAFLASRSLDEQLSEVEQKRLYEALAVSEPLRAEVAELTAIARLVGRWGQTAVELDWAVNAELIRARAVASPDDVRDNKLDELLKSWAGERPAIDEEAFAAAVMATVDARSHRTRRRNLVLRLAVPLAAAAAVAVVVTGTLRDWSSPAPRVEISIGPAHTGAESSPEPTRVAVVSFRREPVPGFTSEPTSPEISFMVVGALPPTEDWPEEPPPS